MAAKKLKPEIEDVIKQLNATRKRLRKLAAEEQKQCKEAKKKLKVLGIYESPDFFVEFESGKREVADSKLMKKLGVFGKYSRVQKFDKLSITEKAKK